MLNDSKSIQFFNQKDNTDMAGRYFCIDKLKKGYIAVFRNETIDDFLTIVHEIKHSNEAQINFKLDNFGYLLFDELGTIHIEDRATKYLSQFVAKEEINNISCLEFNNCHNNFKRFLISSEIIDYLEVNRAKIGISEEELQAYLQSKGYVIDNITDYVTGNLYNDLVYAVGYIYNNWVSTNIEESKQLAVINDMHHSDNNLFEIGHYGVPQKTYKLVDNLHQYHRTIRK